MDTTQSKDWQIKVKEILDSIKAEDIIQVQIKSQDVTEDLPFPINLDWEYITKLKPQWKEITIKYKSN